MSKWFVLALLLGIGSAARADEGPIRVEHAWSRAAAQGRPGVLYMTVTDAGAPDQLTGVDTPVAAKAELHESSNEGGVMKMRPVAAIPVSPREPAVLKPGGYHVMLLGLRKELREGDTFPITLHFASASPVTATAQVARAGAASPDPMVHDHGEMRH